MSHLKLLIIGFLTGSLCSFAVLEFHIVRAEDGFHVVPRSPAPSIRLAYSDIRDWSTDNWTEYPELIRALHESDADDLIGRSVVGRVLDSLESTIDRAVPDSVDVSIHNPGQSSRESLGTRNRELVRPGENPAGDSIADHATGPLDLLRLHRQADNSVTSSTESGPKRASTGHPAAGMAANVYDQSESRHRSYADGLVEELNPPAGDVTGHVPLPRPTRGSGETSRERTDLNRYYTPFR